jgi:hypothetical protein
MGMGLAGMIFALITSAYILGVWTACLVLKQPQQVYEDGTPLSIATARAIVVRTVGPERRL